MSDTILAHLHKLALQLAPELADADLHLLRQQPGWICPRGAEAYAIRGRHLDIKAHLIANGRWRNHWPLCIVFVSEPTVGTLLHELAHVLPAKPPIPDDGDAPTTEQRGFQSGQLLAWAAGDPQALPWKGHDATWIRRALHLRHRATTIGVEVPLEAINAAGDRYGLSTVANYAVELGCEPSILSRKSFREIDETPPPPRYTRLFAQDAATFVYESTLDSLGVT